MGENDRVSDLIDTTEMYLRTIYELEEEGILPLRARIAERLHHSGPTVSQTVARMERAGLVRRQECPSDGRGVIAELTSHGRQVLRSAAPTHVRGVRDNLIDLLSDEERTVLAEVFERVISRQRK